MEKVLLKELLDKYAAEELSDSERSRLSTLLDDPQHRETIAELLEESYVSGEYSTPETPERAQRLTGMLQQRLEQSSPAIARVHRVHFLRRWGWAAAVLLLLAAASWLWLRPSKTSDELAQKPALTPADIAPGHDGAVLTLADGSQMVLDSLGNGLLATQSGSQVILQNGQLKYTAGEREESVVYNTMTIPRGRQFHLELTDGTQVWLNSASSLRYPTRFAGKERKVEITGEAYFEVAPNARMPFRVQVNGHTTIEVLGTSFNVNAYTDEASVNTTLLNGSVRVMQNEAATPQSVTLSPGQQAQVKAGNPITVVPDVDVNKVMAWKNGLFNFENVGLEELMRQFARWYDIEVAYEDGVPDIQFGGKMSRNVTLEDVLNALKGSGVHFRMEEGRKLVVLR